MVNNELPIWSPDIVILIDVVDVGANEALRPATLLAPEETVGTTEAAKKFGG
jgi:hypothetical protein